MVQQVKDVYQTVEAFARQQPGGYGPWWKKAFISKAGKFLSKRNRM